MPRQQQTALAPHRLVGRRSALHSTCFHLISAPESTSWNRQPGAKASRSAGRCRSHTHHADWRLAAQLPPVHLADLAPAPRSADRGSHRLVRSCSPGSHADPLSCSVMPRFRSLGVLHRLGISASRRVHDGAVPACVVLGPLAAEARHRSAGYLPAGGALSRRRGLLGREVALDVSSKPPRESTARASSPSGRTCSS